MPGELNVEWVVWHVRPPVVRSLGEQIWRENQHRNQSSVIDLQNFNYWPHKFEKTESAR